MSTKTPLSSNILSTGNKFVITEKTTDGVFKPGTVGIVSYVKGIDTECSNVAYFTAIILKRGKTGKQRIDLEQISTPIFSFEKMGLSTVMPDKKRKRYLYMEPMPQAHHSIQSMSNLNYLGWALSWSCYLNQLAKCTKPFRIWPKKNNDIMNRILNIAIHWHEDRDSTIDMFCSIEKRKNFVEKMRMMEATLFNCSLLYMLKIAECEVKASEYLIHNNDKIKTCDKEMLNSTYLFFKEKHTNLKELSRRNSSTKGNASVFRSTSKISSLS